MVQTESSGLVSSGLVKENAYYVQGTQRCQDGYDQLGAVQELVRTIQGQDEQG